MNYPNASTLTLVVLLPLLGWRLYSRFKRMVGRQRLSRVRPWITLAIFPALVLLILAATLSHPERLWLLAAGLCAGTLLGIYRPRQNQVRTDPGRAFLHTACFISASHFRYSSWRELGIASWRCLRSSRTRPMGCRTLPAVHYAEYLWLASQLLYYLRGRIDPLAISCARCQAAPLKRCKRMPSLALMGQGVRGLYSVIVARARR